jgi:polyisoprenoid-binding protein YceI
MFGDTRRTVAVVVTALVVVGLLLGGGYGLWYLFLRPAGPAAVDATSVPLPSSVASSAPLTGGIDGTWKVDTSIGSFSDFSDSFVGYRVQEELAGFGANTAVGRTPSVSGTMTIAGTTVSDVSIEADLTTLQSDDPRRDGQLSRQGIQTGQFPTASFKLTTPIDLGSVPADGQEISLTAQGQLTLHGQTRDVRIPLKAKLSGSVIVVTGSLEITFADYGIAKPSSFAVLSIADTGTMELQLYFTRS